MSTSDILESLIEKDNGYLITSKAVESGVSKPSVSKYVREHDMEKVAHGIYILDNVWPDELFVLQQRNKLVFISFDVLKKAFAATCMKRETSFGEEEVRETLDKIKDDSGLEEMWNRFKRVNYFVDDLPWGEISETIVDNIEKISFFSDQVSWISDEKGIKDRNKF